MKVDSAQSEDYTGPAIRGPSTGWVKLAEGEEVISPVTPLKWAQRSLLGLPVPALSPRCRRLIQIESNSRLRLGVCETPKLSTLAPPVSA